VGAPGAIGRRGAKELPGFAVAIVLGMLAMRRKKDLSLSVRGADGDDVPGVGGNYVGGDEVETGAGVGRAVGSDVAFIRMSALVAGAFDLDAEEASVVFDGEIVGRHVSPGLGDAEAVLGGASHETQFGPFAPRFGVRDIRIHEFFRRMKKRPWTGRNHKLFVSIIIIAICIRALGQVFGKYIFCGCREMAGIESI
jgi:hypothetical protein